MAWNYNIVNLLLISGLAFALLIVLRNLQRRFGLASLSELWLLGRGYTALCVRDADRFEELCEAVSNCTHEEKLILLERMFGRSVKVASQIHEGKALLLGVEGGIHTIDDLEEYDYAR